VTPGRKPKPVEQRRREGNAGKRNLPARVDLGGAGIPSEAPPDFPPAARELWAELVPALNQHGVLNRVDAAAMAALCLQWARGVAARQVIDDPQDGGLFALGSMGQIVEHPALGIERAAHAAFLRFAEHYGITPVARARISALLRPEPPKPPALEPEVIDAK
jgi:P27 family predicted phage terminase small subunit